MRIALACGEPSGDLLGAGLARALRVARPDVELAGITGPAMRAAGVHSWMGCEGFTVMGRAQGYLRLPALLWHYRKAVAALAKARPAVFVGLDAPDLNMRLGQRARALGSKYVQYVCPSFWAWREKRAAALAAHCAQVLALLPFEVGECAAAAIPAKFVGHRLARELPPDPARRAAARQRLGIAEHAQVLAVLPGSRRQEITAHAGLFLAAAEVVRQRRPEVEVWQAPLAPYGVSAGQHVRSCPGQARDLLAAADAALVKSGTVTLEAAMLDCPQVVAYRIGRVDSWLVGMSLRDVHDRHYSLPNLVAGRGLVPEFVQERATVPALAAAVLDLFNPEVAATQRAGYAIVRAALDVDTDRAAAAAVLAAV